MNRRGARHAGSDRTVQRHRDPYFLVAIAHLRGGAICRARAPCPSLLRYQHHREPSPQSLTGAVDGEKDFSPVIHEEQWLCLFGEHRSR